MLKRIPIKLEEAVLRTLLQAEPNLQISQDMQLSVWKYFELQLMYENASIKTTSQNQAIKAAMKASYSIFTNPLVYTDPKSLQTIGQLECLVSDFQR